MALKRYRNKTCGYCGKNTGPNGEGEHVLPKCIYTKFGSPKIQRLKIPACPDCNNSWEADEAHFRAMLVICGPDPTAARRELWARSLRGLDRPDHGRKEALSIAQQFVPSPILNPYGRPYQRVFPHKDARVVRVLKKIVRGLTFYRTSQVIPEDLVDLQPAGPPLPTAYQNGLTALLTIPEIFSAKAFFADSGADSEVHSVWVLEFFGTVRFYALVERAGEDSSFHATSPEVL